MANDPGFIAYLRELLEPLGTISVRSMFGGHGIYCDGSFFALVDDDDLYLKVDPQTRGEFEAAGCAPFVYQGQAKPIEMSYWSVPASALDSADALLPWARLALAAAARKASRTRPRR